MSNLNVGKPDVSPDASAHTPGIKQGNATGNYEKRPGTSPDGRSTAERSTGINPKGARADRPADAEPVARRRRAAGGDRDRGGTLRGAAGAIPTLAFAVTGAGAPRARGGPDAALRAARSRRRRRAGALGHARRRRSGSRRAARATRTRPTTGCSSCSAPRAAGARRCARCCGRARRWSVPPFTGQTDVDLLVPCTYDLEVAAAAVPRTRSHDGEVPLEFLFSGTVFYAGRRRPPADGADRRGTSRPSTACPSPCGARRWTTTSPAAPGCGSTARRTTGSSPTSRAGRCRRGPP